MDARAANERIANKAQQLRFNSRVPMMCECSTPGCRTIVMITLQQYREVREEPANILTAPGHNTGDAELMAQTSTYEVHRPANSGNGGRRYA